MEKTIKNSHFSNKKKKGYLKSSKSLAEKIGFLSLSKKAENILIFDLRELTSITDYFVICSGNSDKHIKAITDAITEGVYKDLKINPWHIEGYTYLRWVLIDYVDVVAHIFLKEIREYYDLERLWGDAKIIEIKDDDYNSGE